MTGKSFIPCQACSIDKNSEPQPEPQLFTFPKYDVYWHAANRDSSDCHQVHVLQINSTHEEDLDASSKKRTQIRSSSMLGSENSLFRNAISQPLLTKIELDRHSNTSCLHMKNGALGLVSTFRE